MSWLKFWSLKWFLILILKYLIHKWFELMLWVWIWFMICELICFEFFDMFWLIVFYVILICLDLVCFLLFCSLFCLFCSLFVYLIRCSNAFSLISLIILCFDWMYFHCFLCLFFLFFDYFDYSFILLLCSFLFSFCSLFYWMHWLRLFGF